MAGPMTICHSPCSVARRRSARGFTIVEVMMASVILVVGFMGMIQAITLGSEMLATARRQTLAAQILEHEIGKLRLAGWGTVSSLTDVPATTYDSDRQAIDNAIAASGVSFTLERDVSAPTSDLVEVTFILRLTAASSSFRSRPTSARS